MAGPGGFSTQTGNKINCWNQVYVLRFNSRKVGCLLLKTVRRTKSPNQQNQNTKNPHPHNKPPKPNHASIPGSHINIKSSIVNPTSPHKQNRQDSCYNVSASYPPSPHNPPHHNPSSNPLPSPQDPTNQPGSHYSNHHPN